MKDSTSSSSYNRSYDSFDSLVQVPSKALHSRLNPIDLLEQPNLYSHKPQPNINHQTMFQSMRIYSSQQSPRCNHSSSSQSSFTKTSPLTVPQLNVTSSYKISQSISSVSSPRKFEDKYLWTERLARGSGGQGGGGSLYSTQAGYQ